MSLKCAAVVAAVAAAAASGCGYQPGHMGAPRAPESFKNNGERIYFTGTSERGGDIVAEGGGMHMRMMGGSCAGCHGVDRRGGVRMMPFFWNTAPALTAEALFDDHVESGGHGDHDAYDETALRRAITNGVDPSGRKLDDAMPRWRMPDEDLDDLIAFLKS